MVNKNWRCIADDAELCERIRPSQTFGTREWKYYLNLDAGIEPPLPRRAYGDLEYGNHFLTFIPNKIRIDYLEIALNNLKAIGNLIKKPITKFSTGFFEGVWEHELIKIRKNEKSHWVWINKKIIGRNKTYEQQQELILEVNKKIAGSNISGLIDISICLFMDYIRYGKFNFGVDLLKKQFSYIRVKEDCERAHISIGFTSTGIDIVYASFGFGFLVARKYFGS